MSTIYIANDAGSKEFASDIRRRVTAEVEVREMDAGDFAFEGKGPNGRVFVGIERKAIGDMISSMRSGRYAGFQLIKMSRDFDVCYLLVEGLWRPSADGLLEVPAKIKGQTKWVPYRLSMRTKLRAHSTPYAYSELDKHFCTVEALKNVIVIRSTCRIETVWQVVNRFQWWSKPWDQHHSADPIKTQAEVSLQYVSLARQVANVLPGVGWKKSIAVANYFQTTENMALASEAQWVSVVGPSLAAKLHAALRSKK